MDRILTVPEGERDIFAEAYLFLKKRRLESLGITADLTVYRVDDPMPPGKQADSRPSREQEAI